MSPAGRPPLPPDQRRTQKLPIRVSPKDIQTVRSHAKAARMPVTAWIRKRLGL